MTEQFISKELFSISAIVVTLFLFAPYIISIRRGNIYPHVFSWLVWAFGTFVVFFAQLSDGAGLGAWPIGLSACITSYIAYLAFIKRAAIDITRTDWILFLLAISALPIWLTTSDPFWAVVLLTIADLIGFGPTLRRGYDNPHQEHMVFFAVGGFRNILVILALENYSWTTMLFPAAVGIACVLVAVFLLIRRIAVGSQNSSKILPKERPVKDAKSL